MKLVLVASLLLLAVMPVVGATPIHPRVCTEATGNCPGFACAAADASAVPVCAPGPQVNCLEFYNRVTVGPVTITYGGCTAPSVHVDSSILQ